MSRQLYALAIFVITLFHSDAPQPRRGRPVAAIKSGQPLRSDAFSFLFFDILHVAYGDEYLMKKLYVAIRLMMEATYGKPDWCERELYWGVIQAMKPEIEMGLFIGGLGERRVFNTIYGDETWFERSSAKAEPERVTGQEKTNKILQGGPRDNAGINQELDDMHRQHLLQADMDRPPPHVHGLEQFTYEVDKVWSDNPYLADFQHRYGISAWSVPLNCLGIYPDGQNRHFGPHRRDGGGGGGGGGGGAAVADAVPWLSYLRIGVFPTWNMAQIYINEKEFGVSDSGRLRRTVSAFWVLHAGLLRAIDELASAQEENGGVSERELQEAIFEVFEQAAQKEENVLSPTTSVGEHWNAIRQWRPEFGKRE
ncbi:hypothetical protein C8035_v011704 [Colletotrichum spinosum]|uniref:Uncharacterized protein n=1 Tax=Colletotrichum spinosum TaxID=1347390 RepID=A0A4R8QBM6_9PEZI|nr:hypothetical protein C8035_v011704 [Colletotrichum spinosum]